MEAWKDRRVAVAKVLATVLVVVTCADVVTSAATHLHQQGRTLTPPFDINYDAFGMPQWQKLGDTMVSSDALGQDVVRLTMADQSRRGLIFNTVPVSRSFDLEMVKQCKWQIFLELQIPKTPKSDVPADGMGVFFSLNKPALGSQLGMREDFVGFAIMIDTYRNARYRSRMKQPYVYAMINDGTVKYNDETDGSDVEIAPGCNFDFDKKIRMLIKYTDGELAVLIAEEAHSPYFSCFKTQAPFPTPRMPNYQEGHGMGFFALSAQTGHYFNQHDIYKVIVNVEAPMESEDRGFGNNGRDDGRASDRWSRSNNDQNSEQDRLQRKDRFQRNQVPDKPLQIPKDIEVAMEGSKKEVDISQLSAGLSEPARKRLGRLVTSIGMLTSQSAAMSSRTRKLSEDASKAEETVDTVRAAKKNLDKGIEKLRSLMVLVEENIDKIDDFKTETLSMVQKGDWESPEVSTASEYLERTENRSSLLFVTGVVLSQLIVGMVVLYARAKERQSTLFSS
eukprot:CAMPEP_0185845748 /NCGR_PEP_ID=MMETSP1354-20130828/1628_1 /TAXON_ID=708628 /ORGANISM="Erythrolobus madagascarensis, Strain CCMP3276" /LENGTH=505 /DNA_ID=CAMNT_0028545783 /DNA_START=41 /DNA_END=1558 /DNA_ORIENTATION=+